MSDVRRLELRYPDYDGWHRFGVVYAKLCRDEYEAGTALGIFGDQVRDLLAGRATCDWAEAERRLRDYAAKRAAGGSDE